MYVCGVCVCVIMCVVCVMCVCVVVCVVCMRCVYGMCGVGGGMWCGVCLCVCSVCGMCLYGCVCSVYGVCVVQMLNNNSQRTTENMSRFFPPQLNCSFLDI